MAVLVWVAVGTALWHFTVFIPDRFHGGIVGAFVWANFGALLAGWMSEGFGRPGLQSVELVDAFVGLTGGLAGLALAYVLGSRVEPDE
jgi:hypothetical protein